MRLRGLSHLLLMLILLFFASSCERQTQYKILTTVFTGVPPMEELYADKVPEEKMKQINPDEESKEILYLHPLWAARQCTACHEAGADLKVNMVEAVNSKQQKSIPAKLILPADKLCIKCHLDKTARRAIRERLWLHNPVARGGCLSCHSEHQSVNLAHLRQSPRGICSSCHKSDQLPGECFGKPIIDQTKNNCLNCHNTHMGRNRFLLTRDYTEAKIPARPVPEPASPQASPFFQTK